MNTRGWIANDEERASGLIMKNNESIPFYWRMISLIGHQLPLKSGLMRIATHPLMRRIKPTLSHPFDVRLRNGIRVTVGPDDLNGLILSLFGTEDPKVVGICSTLVQSCDLLLDIGANYGSVGLLCIKQMNPKGRIHLFEPNPRLARMLEQVAEDQLNGEVVVHPIALADHDGSIGLSFPDGNNSGSASIIIDQTTHSTKTVEVPVRSTRSYLSNIVDNATFGVKLDIEGAERFVLPWIVCQPNLRFVVFECTHFDSDFDWFTPIKKAGLLLFAIERKFLTVRLSPISTPSDAAPFHDLVAIRPRHEMSSSRTIGLRQLAKLVIS